MSFQRVSTENFATSILGFIQKNSKEVESYEDILEVYLSMVRGRYIFTVERELMIDMLSDIVYFLNPSDGLNKMRVLDNLERHDDSDDEDCDEDCGEGDKRGINDMRIDLPGS
jgi:hypothetical protein